MPKKKEQPNELQSQPGRVLADPPAERLQAPLEPGIWHHYKGGLYTVIAEIPLVDNGEDAGEAVVLYAPLYGDRALRTRTKRNWLQLVDHGNSYCGSRFQHSRGIHVSYLEKDDRA